MRIGLLKSYCFVAYSLLLVPLSILFAYLSSYFVLLRCLIV